jgi:hypothetical protein
MKMTLRLLCSVALLAAALATWAFPTLFADTGIVMAPIADVQQEATVELAVDFLPMKTPAGNTVSFPIRLIYGLGTNFEIGVLYSEAKDNIKGVNVYGGAVKMSLIDETLYGKNPGVAVGLRAYREKGVTAGELTAAEGYLAVSKLLLVQGDNVEEGFTIRAHSGLIYTSYSGAVTANFIKPYLGISYMSAHNNSVSVEYLPEQKSGAMMLREATISAAIRRPLSDHFWLEVGTTRAFGLGDSNVAYGGIIYRYSDNGIYEEQTPVIY